MEAKTTHNVYDEQGNVSGVGTFDKDEMESEGTKKVIEMSGPIFDTLRLGKVLIVDELDAKLHPFSLVASCNCLWTPRPTLTVPSLFLPPTIPIYLILPISVVIRSGLPRKTRPNRPTFIPCLSSRMKTVRKSGMTEAYKRLYKRTLRGPSLS